VADDLSCLDTSELTIPKEEDITIVSESENSNIKFLIHAILIFSKELKDPGLSEKGLSQPYYSMQHTKRYIRRIKFIFLSDQDKEYYLD
jgi:hypothetical protein